MIEAPKHNERQVSVMEQQFGELLEKDKKLLWCGKPQRFETLDKTNRQSILTGTVIKLIVIGGILALYIYRPSAHLPWPIPS